MSNSPRISSIVQEATETCEIWNQPVVAAGPSGNNKAQAQPTRFLLIEDASVRLETIPAGTQGKGKGVNGLSAGGQLRILTASPLPRGGLRGRGMTQLRYRYMQPGGGPRFSAAAAKSMLCLTASAAPQLKNSVQDSQELKFIASNPSRAIVVSTYVHICIIWIRTWILILLNHKTLVAKNKKLASFGLVQRTQP
jgi:hypothetical protein